MRKASAVAMILVVALAALPSGALGGSGPVGDIRGHWAEADI